VNITHLTATGVLFDLQRPKPSMVKLEDIAISLSRLSRYNGATTRDYCVAEHALLVVEILERSFGNTDAMVLRAALHHDSEEAYTGDITRPVQDLISLVTGVSWSTIKAPIVDVVQQHFGINDVARTYGRMIKLADKVAAATEQRDLRIGLDRPAPGVGVDWIDLGTRGGLTRDDWAQAFVDKHLELQAMLDARARA
jgi:hypothetical protein